MMGVQNNLVFQCCRFFGAFRQLSRCYGKKMEKWISHRFSQEAREFRFVNFWAFPKHDSRVKTKPGPWVMLSRTPHLFLDDISKQSYHILITNLNSLLNKKKLVKEFVCNSVIPGPKRPWLEKKIEELLWLVIFVTTTSDRLCCWGKSSSPCDEQKCSQ